MAPENQEEQLQVPSETETLAGGEASELDAPSEGDYRLLSKLLVALTTKVQAHALVDSTGEVGVELAPGGWSGRKVTRSLAKRPEYIGRLDDQAVASLALVATKRLGESLEHSNG